MKSPISWLVALALLAAGPALNAQTLLTLQNSSFELPAFSGPGSFGTITPYGGAPDQIPGWTSPNVAGVLYPTASEYPSVPDGNQVAFTDSSTPIAQTLGTSLQAGTYQLTVAVGWRGAGFAFGGGSFGLYGTDGTPLAVTVDVSPAAPGTFQDEFATLIVPQGSPEIGNTFQVELSGTSPHVSGFTTDYDNVRLSFTAAPEPGTWILLMGGVAALFAACKMRVLRI